MRGLVVLLALWLAAAPAAEAAPEVWQALREGGQVALLRHAETVPGAGDPPGWTLDDCASQRNLSAAGRQQARDIGAVLAERQVTFRSVLSSPWCRCLETARLATGMEPAIEPALMNLFHAPEARAERTAALREIVRNWQGPGNLLIVSHGANITPLTGDYPRQGEIQVVTPTPDADAGFVKLGRLTPKPRD